METLPNEMLELIIRKLTPCDIAHCSAVCRSWYETMNQDWIWAPYCDLELEERLRTIPSAATPTFEIPETKTLSPISRWKWAFLREKRLWMNWRPEKMEQLKKEIIVDSENNNCLGVDFFSDTLIVVWYSSKIEIVDVSGTPAVIVAKTDMTVSIERVNERYVVGTDLLLVEKDDSIEESPYIEVFNVDIANKSITLKYDFFNIYSYDNINPIAKENFYVFTDDERVKLKILDLSAGRILKEDTCPVKSNPYVYPCVRSIKISHTSDYIAVGFVDPKEYHHRIFVYSLKQLKFLPGPEIKAMGSFDMSLHDHWFAIHQTEEEGDNGTVTIYSISETEEVIFSDEISFPNYIDLTVCNGCFVFIDIGFTANSSSRYVRVYSPSSKTVMGTIAIDVDHIWTIAVINNKFIAITGKTTNLLKVLNQKIEMCHSFAFINCNWKTNRSFTKGIKKCLESSDHPKGWYIGHFW